MRDLYETAELPIRYCHRLRSAMKASSLILSILLGLTSTLLSADLGALQSSFIARYDELNETRDEQLKKLQASYAGALERHLEKTKASGDIEKAIPVRDEIEAIKAGTDPLPELPESSDPELKGMRTKYVEAKTKVNTTHAESLVSLADKMSAALEGEEKDLTRKGKLDDALAAKRMRETLGEDQGIVGARELLGRSEESTKLAATEPAEWKLLMEERMKVEEEGTHDVGSLADVAQGGRRFWNRILTGGDEDKADEILVTPSPCRVSFKTDDPVSEIRGTIKIAFPNASATVRVKVGDESVFKGNVSLLAQELTLAETFTAGDEIEIEVEQVGDAPAWIYWSGLEVR